MTERSEGAGGGAACGAAGKIAPMRMHWTITETSVSEYKRALRGLGSE